MTLSSDVMSPIVRYYTDANGRDGSNGFSRQWGILFASGIDARPVDDSKADASVRTTVDFGTGRISRRIKHFTGYNIYTGLPCLAQDSDPYCIGI